MPVTWPASFRSVKGQQRNCKGYDNSTHSRAYAMFPYLRFSDVLDLDFVSLQWALLITSRVILT